MQLEELIKSLGLEAHTAALSEFRDELLRNNAAALQAAQADAKTELDAAQAEIAELKATIEAGKKVLAEHQKISDDLANRAAAAMATGDVAALPAIIADAKVFGDAREKKNLSDEAAKLEEEAAAILAKAAELKAKASNL